MMTAMREVPEEGADLRNLRRRALRLAGEAGVPPAGLARAADDLFSAMMTVAVHHYSLGLALGPGARRAAFRTA